MYSILIVEDEEIERNSLISMVSESILQIDHIYYAKDGVEAIEQYGKYAPDIVLLDINLPRLNGLESAKKIKKMAKNRVVRFIIQTSYDQFSYAQESIAIGVEDFILKPASPQKVIGSISKIIQTYQIEHNVHQQTKALLHKVDYMKRALELECMKMILANQNEKAIQSLLILLHMKLKSGFCIVVNNFIISQDELEQMKSDIADLGYFSLMNTMEHQFIFFILYAEKMEAPDKNDIKEVLIKYHIFDYPIGIGNVCKGIDELYKSYYYASSYIYIRDADDFILYDMQDRQIQKKEINCLMWVNDFIKIFENQSDEKLQQHIHRFAECLLPLDVEIINTNIDSFIDIMMKRLYELYQIDYTDSSIKHTIIREDDKYQILEIQIVYILNTLLTPVKNLRYQNINPLTKRALKFIREHYNKPISLFDVASALDVSPFYVSKLLNGELHKTFTDVVNDQRIEQAKYLLKGHHTVKEIAGEIGFRNSGYFAKIFKKTVGITPSEYRDIFL